MPLFEGKATGGFPTLTPPDQSGNHCDIRKQHNGIGDYATGARQPQEHHQQHHRQHHQQRQQLSSRVGPPRSKAFDMDAVVSSDNNARSGGKSLSSRNITTNRKPLKPPTHNRNNILLDTRHSHFDVLDTMSDQQIFTTVPVTPEKKDSSSISRGAARQRRMQRQRHSLNQMQPTCKMPSSVDNDLVLRQLTHSDPPLENNNSMLQHLTTLSARADSGNLTYFTSEARRKMRDKVRMSTRVEGEREEEEVDISVSSFIFKDDECTVIAARSKNDFQENVRASPTNTQSLSMTASRRTNITPQVEKIKDKENCVADGNASSSLHYNSNIDESEPRSIHGFSFDAFGLDPIEVNNEVDAALQDLAATNPDLGVFFGGSSHITLTLNSSVNSCNNTSFSNASGGSCGYGGSGTPTTTLATEEEEYDTDGFKAMPPLPVKVSPKATAFSDRSSLTSSNSEGRYQLDGGRFNIFKQQAGFHTSKKKSDKLPPLPSLQQQNNDAINIHSDGWNAFDERLSDDSPQHSKSESSNNRLFRVPTMPDLAKGIVKNCSGPHGRSTFETCDQISFQGGSNGELFPVNSKIDRSDAGGAHSCVIDATSNVNVVYFGGDEVVISSDVVDSSDVDLNMFPREVIRSKLQKKEDDTKQLCDDCSKNDIHLHHGQDQTAVDLVCGEPRVNVSTLRASWEQRDTEQARPGISKKRLCHLSRFSQNIQYDHQYGRHRSVEIAAQEDNRRNSHLEQQNDKTQLEQKSDKCLHTDKYTQQQAFSSLKERLRPAQSRNIQESATKPEVVGRNLPQKSKIRTILNSNHNQSHQEAKSDTTATGSAEFLNGVELRKTRLSNYSTTSTNIEDWRNQQFESPPDLDEVHKNEQCPHQSVVTTDGDPRKLDQKPKMSCRESQELESKKDGEREENKGGIEEQKQATKELDVASLVRKRVAANRKKLEEIRPKKSIGASEDIGSLKSRLKKTASGDESLPTARPPKFKSPANLHKFEKLPGFPTESPLLTTVSGSSIKQNDVFLELGRTINKKQAKAIDDTFAANEHNYLQSDLKQKMKKSYMETRACIYSTLVSDSNVTKAEDAETDETIPLITKKKDVAKANLAAFLGNKLRLPHESKVECTPIQLVSNDDPKRKDAKCEERSPCAAPVQFKPRNRGHVALKVDPSFEKYFRMLKVGMPIDVVKHAMIRDGLDESVLDGDHDKPAGGVPLKNDPKYEKYFKMLKVGIPMGAIKNAMQKDGLNPSIIDGDHNVPVSSGVGDKAKQDRGPKDTHRRTRLHWETLRKVRANSLWAKIKEDPELQQLHIDEDEFEQLFQAELTPSNHSNSGTKSCPSKKLGPSVRVIDRKRANNGGIILARLKISQDDMADAVDKIDDMLITAEQMQNVVEFLPTSEERMKLEEYMLSGGQDAATKYEMLCECEKFMVAMMTVKHAKRKVRALLFKLQFESCLESLEVDANTVEDSCEQLSNSVRLRKLLGIVLNIGNRLNTAGNGNKCKAGAFTLESLLKLSHAKAFDKKTTFLQYIVMIVQRNNEILLNFKDDLPTVLKADKVYWDQCLSDLEEVENQLENVRRMALHQARLATLYRLRKNKAAKNDGDDSLSEVEMSLEEEVESLRSTSLGLFTLGAIKKVSRLRDKVEVTNLKFGRLLEYFGEEEKRAELQPHELFHIIVKFCRDFDKAKEHVVSNERKKLREERKQQQINIKNPSKATEGPTKPTQLAPSEGRNDLTQHPTRNSALEYQSAMHPPEMSVQCNEQPVHTSVCRESRDQSRNFLYQSERELVLRQKAKTRAQAYSASSKMLRWSPPMSSPIHKANGMQNSRPPLNQSPSLSPHSIIRKKWRRDKNSHKSV